MGPILLEYKLGELSEILVKGKGVNPSLISLVPCHKAWFKHALGDVTDDFGIGLPAMLLVTFACEGPRLHDERGDLPGSEHRALLHLSDLDFSEGLCGG